KIDYVDYHMGTAVATPELRAIVEKLARKYKLGISRYFNENYKTMFDTPVEKKKAEFIEHLTNNLKPNQVNLIVLHVAKPDPEMKALVDMNNASMHSDEEPLVSWHRSAELAMLLSDEFLLMVKTNKIILVNYGDLVNSVGLDSMKAPIN
ncbi:MAG TPA: ChbG/HpnK family deacetylase, partial [Cyclobacteriaceae bacterium]|nr:ChbG/HpnK family deacetylase [Cyclobacteriaceae bacterium]